MIATVLPFPIKVGRSPYTELETRCEETALQLQRAELRAEIAEAHLAKARRELARLEDGLTRRQRRRPRSSGNWLGPVMLAAAMFVAGYVTAGIGW